MRVLPTLFLVAILTSIAAAQTPAFPGAEGYGAFAEGGRGGREIWVTNLNDAGPGSLRAACEAEGPRTVNFRVSGVIALETTLTIRNPYITINGQTAPGDGVCLKDSGLSIATHDAVVRYLRVRPGDTLGREVDGISINNSRRVIVDHCSASWAVDEVFSITGESDEITVQWCIVSEALHDSVHKKGPHGMGSLIRSPGGRYSIHHSIYAHNNTRNPRPGDNYDGEKGVRLDFRNNVIYDWGASCGYGIDGEEFAMNYVGNSLRPGPSTRRGSNRRTAFHIGGDRNQLYVQGNEMDGFADALQDNWKLIGLPRDFSETARNAVTLARPFEYANTTTHTARDTFRLVLDNAGATLPRRDPTDARIIRQIETGTGRIINSQKEVGGWGSYE